MRDQDESQNVEDMRGAGGGGGFQFRPVHGIGLGTIAIALIGGWLFGINPLQILGLLSGGDVSTTQGTPMQQTAPQTQDQGQGQAADDPNKTFVSQTLRSTEVVWSDYFRQLGRTYECARAV